jgi:ATPase subunit of ABC transporter with duplicated ATPase domains
VGVLISCESVSLEYPTRRVLDAVSLGVSDGDRIGIVGRNGDGKSTLLNVVAGTLEPDTGRVTARRDLRVGLLGQKDSLDDAATAGESVVGDRPSHEWAGDPAVRSVIAALMGDIAWDARVGTLSGGQRRRVDLARLLVGDWDVLALDEPTNHLDMRAITWLADHLKRRWAAGSGALLVVTHDRWFLDEVCLNMWEVHDRTVDPFEGGYSAYVQQRLERDRQARAIEDRRQNLLRKELAWLARGPQARGTKPKFRVEAARDLIADVPPMRNDLELKRLAVSRLGKQVVELKNVTARRGEKTVLNDVTWLVGPGDRYGILGANGVGKSTLLGIIDGSLTPAAGSVKIGQTVKFAVLSQRLDELLVHTGQTVREVLNTIKRRYTIDGKEYTPAQMLERLGFEPGQQLTRVEELSGGQQRRLQLLLVLLSEPNVLILDEPGNDMDTDMLAILEDLLDSWPGTLLLVSHDRYLMERVTNDQFMVMDGKVTHVPGGVDEFLRKLDEHDRAAAATAQAQAAEKPAPSAQAAAGTGGLSRSDEYRLRKQLASVERKIEAQRKRVEETQAAMLQVAASDFVELGRLQEKVDAAQAAIDELELEWLELSEQLGE